MEKRMLDMRLQTDRWELARRTGLPVRVLNEFRPTLAELDVIDDGGEPCEVCQTEPGCVELHWYGTDRGGSPVDGQSCRGCVGAALTAADVDPYQPVEIEYLPLVPKAGVVR